MSDPFMAESGPKHPTFKFDQIGATITGTVTSVVKKEDRDLNGELRTWPDGNAKHVFVFTLDTTAGEQSVWARGQMVTAIRDAATTAKVKTIVGTRLSIKYTENGEAKKGQHPAKIYKAKVEEIAQDDSAAIW
jgi:uncharacterized protein YbjT (DUF2867 family)